MVQWHRGAEYMGYMVFMVGLHYIGRYGSKLTLTGSVAYE